MGHDRLGWFSLLFERRKDDVTIAVVQKTLTSLTTVTRSVFFKTPLTTNTTVRLLAVVAALTRFFVAGFTFT